MDIDEMASLQPKRRGSSPSEASVDQTNQIDLSRRAFVPDAAREAEATVLFSPSFRLFFWKTLRDS